MICVGITAATERARQAASSRQLRTLAAGSLVAAFMVAGCGGESPGADSAPTADAAEPTDSAEADADAAEPTDSAESGAEESGTAATLPDGFPPEVPVPEEQLQGTEMVGDAGWRMTYLVDMDDDQVLARYQAVLEDAGLITEVGVPTTANLTAEAAEWSVQVTRNPGVLMLVQVLSAG